MRLLYFGTPEFAVPALRVLAASGQRLVGVVSQPDRPRGRGQKVEPTPVRRAAEELGLEVLQPEKVADEAARAWMRAREPELGVVVAFGQFIPKSVRELPPHGMVNAHASLLPRWRGAAPIEHALDAGDARTGISVMRVVKEMDAGDVCLVRDTAIDPEETAGELAQRLAALAGEALVAAIGEIEAGSARFAPQDAARVTLAPKLERDFGRVDLAQPAERVLRRIRAATPRPGVDLQLAKSAKLVRIARARLGASHGGGAKPGAVRVETGRLFVAAADAWLELVEVQLAGKRAMRADELLRGLRIPAGEEARTP